MPKKTTTARGGAQRNRPKVQKNIQLVRQVSDAHAIETESGAEPTAANVSTTTLEAPEAVQDEIKSENASSDTSTSPRRRESTNSITDTASKKSATASSVTSPAPKESESVNGVSSAAPKGSAAARLAARRQAAQKAQQRAAASLIT